MTLRRGPGWVSRDRLLIVGNKGALRRRTESQKMGAGDAGPATAWRER